MKDAMDTILFDQLERFLDSKRAELIALVDTFDQQQLNWRSQEDSWTVPEIIEHLYMTEAFIVYQVKSLLANNPAMPSESLDKKDVDAFKLLNEKGLIGGTRKAPRQVQPSGSVTIEEGVQKLQAIREQLKSFLPQMKNRETNTLIALLQPLNVEMNVCQWVHFASVHEWGHINQIKRIVAKSKAE